VLTQFARRKCRASLHSSETSLCSVRLCIAGAEWAGSLDRLFIVEGVSRIILPLLLFAIYCAVVMDYYHCKPLRSKSA
jgi:hypothetical protein